MDQHQRALSNAVFRATAEYFKPSAAVFWTARNRVRASGVFLRYRGRYLVVTAAHTICDMKGGEPVYLVGKGVVGAAPITMKRLVGTHDPSIRPGDVSADPFDVGFMEIPIEVAETFSAVRWLGPEHCTSSFMDVDYPALVIGAPGEFDSVTAGHPTVTAANLIAYGTVVTTKPYETLRLPKVQLPDPSRDLVLRFEPDRTVDLRTGMRCDPFDPGGMSGCGVYFPCYMPGGWSPARAKLIAIQSSWAPRDHVLITKRSEVMLHFLEQWCVDPSDPVTAS